MKIYDWAVFMERPGSSPAFVWIPFLEQMELFEDGTDPAVQEDREGDDGETADIALFL